MFFAFDHEINSRLVAKNHTALLIFKFIQSNRDGILTLGKRNIRNDCPESYRPCNLLCLDMIVNIKYFSKMALLLIIKGQMHFRTMHRLVTDNIHRKD